jgi:hypothetical protein
MSTNFVALGVFWHQDDASADRQGEVLKHSSPDGVGHLQVTTRHGALV